MPEHTFPRSHTGFPAPWKSLFHTPEKCLPDRHRRIALISNPLRQRSENRPYVDGGPPVRLYAILSELTLYASSPPLHHMARSIRSRMPKSEDGVWMAARLVRNWNEAPKAMQTMAKRACSCFAECSLPYPNVTQDDDKYIYNIWVII